MNCLSTPLSKSLTQFKTTYGINDKEDNSKEKYCPLSIQITIKKQIEYHVV